MSGGFGPEGGFARALASFSFVPRSLALRLARGAAIQAREETLSQDRLLARTAAGTLLEESLERPVFVLDAYEGGSAVWDWLLLRGGWHSVLWPWIGETALQRLRQHRSLRAVLALDGQAYEEMAERAPAAIDALREALASGRLEAANGAYARASALAISGESHIRQLYYGLQAVRQRLGTVVESYLAADRDLFPQLPQVLAGFGYKRLILLSRLAPLGSDPPEESALVRWQGPDGTELATAARYRFLSPDLAGRPPNGRRRNGLREEALGTWKNERLERFREEAGRRPIGYPLIARAAGLRAAEPPFPRVMGVAARQDLRFVTSREYFDLAAGEAPVVSYGLGGMGSALPWGLDGERLQRETLETENALLLAERLDALAFAMGRQSEEKDLEAAWKLLLRSQHRDFRAYGACVPRQQQKRVVDIAGEMARTARERGREVAQAAASYLASYVDSAGSDGKALVVFNPSSWPRREYVEVTVEGKGCRVAQGGQEIASQIVSSASGSVTVGFVARVPALGYSLLTLSPPAREGETTEQTLSTAAGQRTFANEFFAADLDYRGSLRLSWGERTLLEAGGYLTVWKDGRYHDSRNGISKLERYQQGPVFERYHLAGRLGGIPFLEWVTFYAAIPRIDLRLAFDFGAGMTFGPTRKGEATEEDEKKLCLNLASSLGRAFADSPFLVSELTGERTAALRLAGLDDDWERGVALLNRGTPGYRFDRDAGVLQNVLAWSPNRWPPPEGLPLPEPVARSRLRGTYVFESAILPFASRIEALRAAVDYQLPCLGVLVPARSGRLPAEGSFLSLEPEQALLSALFVQANRVYARLWNGSPDRHAATLGSGGPLSLYACSLDLTEREAVQHLDLPPWGLGTLRLGAGQA